MARTATQTTTKAATEEANARTTRPKKAVSDKPKKQSAFTAYISTHLKAWREAHPGSTPAEAMKAVAVEWREAPENPNRGKDPKARAKPAAKPKHKSSVQAE